MYKNIDYDDLKKQIVFKNININEINKIAGVDVAYYNIDGIEYGVCSILVFDFKTLELITKVNSSLKVDIPYKPGYLGIH